MGSANTYVSLAKSRTAREAVDSSQIYTIDINEDRIKDIVTESTMPGFLDIGQVKRYKAFLVDAKGIPRKTDRYSNEQLRSAVERFSLGGR